MIGGLISNALGEGTGNGLITSALCMQSPKSDTAKLIIHFDLYEVLKSDLSGFYNTVTPLGWVNVKFAVLDFSRNVVYTSPYNTVTNNTEIELPNGKYTVKLLFSAYGIAGGEEQTVTVSGETVYTIKLYKRHFKAMTVTGGNYDVYNGTMLSYYGDPGYVGQADEVIALSQINVYELKWDKWEKILNYNCIPVNFDVETYSEYYYRDGHISGIRTYKTQYFGSIVTAQSGFSPPGNWYPNGSSRSTTFTGWEDGEAVFTTILNGNTSTSKYTSSQMGLDNLNYIYNAATLYHDGKSYSGVDSIDNDFFNKYNGKALLKWKVETNEPMYSFGDPRNQNTTVYRDFVKIYLPTVNYFNADLLSEREIAEQNGAHFWNESYQSLKAVKINEDGTVQNYASKMIYNGLEVTKINSVENFSWYSEDYSQY